MTREQLLEGAAKTLFESRYPFSWDVASKRVLNENLYAEAEQCRKDAKAVLDYISPMMESVVAELNGIKRCHYIVDDSRMAIILPPVNALKKANEHANKAIAQLECFVKGGGE